MAQDPEKWIRANPQRPGENDNDYEARYNQSVSAVSAPPATPRVAPESTAVAPQAQTPASSGKSLGEEVVGGVRTFMNKATMGGYAKAAGALNQVLGGGATPEQIAQDIAQFQERNKRTAGILGLAGTVAPYMVGVGEAAAAGRIIPAVGRALGVGEKAYAAAKAAPILRTVLPASGAMAGEIAAIEGVRGAAEAAPDESRLAAALKNAGYGLLGGRAGEMAGTYLAGKLGPTISGQAAKAEQVAQDAGKLINQYRETAKVQLTPELAKLYARSKPLREAVDQTASELGLMATDPKVLAEAYSKLTEAATPVFRGEILKPFLREIDKASNIPLSKGVKAYGDAMDVIRSITKGRQTGEYLRTGAGTAEKVGPEVLLGRMGRANVGAQERKAAAQAIIASLAEDNPLIARSLFKTATTAGRGLGKIADVAHQLGGTASPMQAALQRAGTVFGASR
jgi:hypothetical protein